MNIILYSIFQLNIGLYVYLSYSLALCYCKSINLECSDKHLDNELYFQNFYQQNSLIFENEKESLSHIDDSEINILKLTFQIQFPEEQEIVKILFTQHQRLKYENNEYNKQQQVCVLINKLDNNQLENYTKQYIISCTYIDFDQNNTILFNYFDQKNNFMSVYVNETCTDFIFKQQLEFYLLCHSDKEIKIYLLDLKLYQNELIFYQETQKDLQNCSSEFLYFENEGFLIGYQVCRDWFVQLLNENFDALSFIDSTIMNEVFPHKIFSHLQSLKAHQNNIYLTFQSGYIKFHLQSINMNEMQFQEVDNLKILLFDLQSIDIMEIKEVENNLIIETQTQNLILGTIKAQLIKIDQIILIAENEFLTLYFSASFYLDLQLGIGNILQLNMISNNLFSSINDQRQLFVYQIKKSNFIFKPKYKFFYEIIFWDFFSSTSCQKINVQNSNLNDNNSNKNIIQLEILNQCEEKGFSYLSWKEMNQLQYPFYFLFDDQVSEEFPIIRQQLFLDIDKQCNQQIIQNPQLFLLDYKFSNKYSMYNNDSILIFDFCNDSLLFEINITDYIVLQQNNYLVLLSYNQTQLQIINDIGSFKTLKIELIHHPYLIQYFPEYILVYFKEYKMPVIYERHLHNFTYLAQDIYLNQTILFYTKHESYQFIQYQDVLIIFFKNNLELVQLKNCTIFEIRKISTNGFQIFAVHNSQNTLLIFLYIDQNLIEQNQISLLDFLFINPFNYKFQLTNLGVVTQKKKLYIFQYSQYQNKIFLYNINDFKTLNLQNIQFSYDLSNFAQTNLVETINKNISIISIFSKDIKQNYTLQIKIINLCYKLFKKQNNIIFEQYFYKNEQKYIFEFLPSQYFLNTINYLEINENQDYVLQGPFIMHQNLNKCEENGWQAYCLKKQNLNYLESHIEFFSINESNQFLGQIVVTNNYSICQINETSFFYIYLDQQYLHILFYKQNIQNNSLQLIQEWKVVNIYENSLLFLNSINIQQQRNILLLKSNSYIINLFYIHQEILYEKYQDQKFLDIIQIEDSDNEYLVVQNYSSKIFKIFVIEITNEVQVIHFTQQIQKEEILEEFIKNSDSGFTFSKANEINQQYLQFYSAFYKNEVLKVQFFQLKVNFFGKLQFEINTKNENFSVKVLKTFRVQPNPKIIFSDENFILLSNSLKFLHVYDIREELDFHDYVYQIENEYLIKKINNTHQLFIKYSDPQQFYIGTIGFQFVFKNFQQNKILGSLIANNDLSDIAVDMEFRFLIQKNDDSTKKQNNYYYLILVFIFSMLILIFSFFARRRKMILKFQQHIKDLENSNIQ